MEPCKQACSTWTVNGHVLLRTNNEELVLRTKHFLSIRCNRLPSEQILHAVTVVLRAEREQLHDTIMQIEHGGLVFDRQIALQWLEQPAHIIWVQDTQKFVVLADY